MLPISYVIPDEFTSPKWCAAFAAGCHGALREANSLVPGPVALFGSPKRWELLQTAIREGRDWYYGDHAYFGRHEHYRVTKNRLQHDGIPRAGQSASYARSRLDACGITITPNWRTTGRHIVLCPNSPVYMALFGIDAKQWCVDVTAELARYTDRPVRVRWKSQVAARPLAVDLVDAWAVVAFSSNSTVDALVAGIPGISLAPFAASARMGRTRLAEIEYPLYPDDREAFLSTLAMNQWTLDEITRGDAWRYLRYD